MPNSAARMPGHIGIVGHQYYGDAFFPVELLEHGQHFLAGMGVKVAGRLVGKQQRRPVDQRPRDGHPLLLPARQLRWLVM